MNGAEAMKIIYKNRVVLFLLLIPLFGCSNRVYKSAYQPNPDAIQYGFHLNEIDEQTYDLSFLGNPGTTMEYAIDTWKQRADGLCAPYGYTVTNPNNVVEKGVDEYPNKPLMSDGEAAAVGSVVGGVVGGLFFGVFSADSATRKDVTYPKIQGIIHCNSDNESQQDESTKDQVLNQSRKRGQSEVY